MISTFVVFRCHGNIDFCKIMILRNSSLNPEAVKISSRYVKGKSTKKSFKNLRYRNTLIWTVKLYNKRKVDAKTVWNSLELLLLFF